MPACRCRTAFPWSLVLCWLCSCFPLRSGTPDDGRPRYELCSFYPSFLHCPSLLPIVLRKRVCVQYVCAYITLVRRSGLKLRIWAVISLILNDLVDFHSPSFFLGWPLFQAHLAFNSPLCWVAVSLLPIFSFFLIIHIYCTFRCFMMMWFKLKGH